MTKWHFDNTQKKKNQNMFPKNVQKIYKSQKKKIFNGKKPFFFQLEIAQNQAVALKKSDQFFFSKLPPAAILNFKQWLKNTKYM